MGWKHRSWYAGTQLAMRTTPAIEATLLLEGHASRRLKLDRFAPVGQPWNRVTWDARSMAPLGGHRATKLGVAEDYAETMAMQESANR